MHYGRTPNVAHHIEKHFKTGYQYHNATGRAGLSARRHLMARPAFSLILTRRY